MWRVIRYSIGVTFFVALFGVGIYLYGVYTEVQSEIESVKRHKMDVTTQIFDTKGRLIANLFNEHYRLYAKFEEIPPRIIEILLAVEDTLFFEHMGINPDAISRAIVKNVKNLKYSEGGSTLTQQVVKNIALSPERTLKRKIKEAMFAIILEQNMSKEDILEIYLNYIFLGHGYYGVRTAALGYFHKNLNELTLKEMCMLMGLPKAPDTYDPSKNLQHSLGRANNILDRLKDIGWITQEEYEVAIVEIPYVYNDKSLTQNVAPYAVDEVVRQLSPIYPDLKTGGYKIYLTIDLDYQNIAQEALRYGYNNINERLVEQYPRTFVREELDSEGLIYAKPKESEANKYGELNGAMVVTESQSGKILALVGGVDYKKSVFNRATQAKRQFGSSIKPFIYLVAFDRGYSPAWQVMDAPRKFGNTNENVQSNQEDEEDVWKPKNVGAYGGLITLREALRKSANLATLNLVQQVGFDIIYRGIKDFEFPYVPNDMSIVLGSLSLSPLEAAKFYSVFSNYGTMITPRLVDSIVNVQGETYTFPIATREYTQPQQAFLVTDILRDVVNRGTGVRARVANLEIAGKTGTSNQNIDGWFCGYSPSIQTIIWYGRDNNTPIGPVETGGIVAAPVNAYFFNKLLKIEPGLKRRFDVPNGIMKKTFADGEYLYTNISKLPPTTPSVTNVEEDLLF
ncbi:penicillin-binding protein [Helicobacter sp. TUL]|uniref:penicillin-binding protein 1A n=1 Tax=Helicobacter sp. TUL TaxID=1848928 RepID=UPI000BCDF570|nr:PBP1A family penicillin-binding protein [Helicobacter sp. TUL]PAU99467.1 penicillin-binding protein [Helicobacter sp. TUL]